VSESAGRTAAPDGTDCSVERIEEGRSLRCFVTADAQPCLQVRTVSAPLGHAAVQLAHDALVLPQLWDFYARRADPRPLADHGRVVGVEVAADVEPQQVWGDAAELYAAVRHIVTTTAPDDRVDRALAHLIALHSRSSHDLATLATFALHDDGQASAKAVTQVHADQIKARVIEGARRIITDAPARADRIAAGVALTATHRPTHLPLAGLAVPDLPIRLPRAVVPPPWIEVGSPSAELAYLQIRRAIPPAATAAELAGALIANQMCFGPYSSLLDDAIRSREAASYLWDCVVDLTRGEFLMLAAPTAERADRVLTVIRNAHSGGESASHHAVDTARRIVRTGILRRIGPAHRVLAAQSEVQRAGLPAQFLASLMAALREVTREEVAKALPAVAAEPLAFTLVVPSA
jgi:hypothetical protein